MTMHRSASPRPMSSSMRYRDCYFMNISTHYCITAGRGGAYAEEASNRVQRRRCGMGRVQRERQRPLQRCRCPALTFDLIILDSNSPDFFEASEKAWLLDNIIQDVGLLITPAMLTAVVGPHRSSLQQTRTLAHVWWLAGELRAELNPDAKCSDIKSLTGLCWMLVSMTNCWNRIIPSTSQSIAGQYSIACYVRLS